jgi:hypothetical protein
MDASAKLLSSEMPLLMVVWGRYLFNLIFVSLLAGYPADRAAQFANSARDTGP